MFSLLSAMLLAIAAAPGGSYLPANLTGEWATGSVSGVRLLDARAGEAWSPSETVITYAFEPDGAYRQTELVQSSIASCTTTVSIMSAGRVWRDGRTLVLVSEAGEMRSTDGCHPGLSYTARVPPRRQTFAWSVLGGDHEGDDLHTELHMDGLVLHRK